MKTEVVPNRQGIPHIQSRVYEWLRRTPEHVERLQVLATGMPDTVVLDINADEVFNMGIENAAERVYSVCEAVAMDNERETRFVADWFVGRDVAMHLPFKLGKNLRDPNGFDGSTVSILAQNQGHLQQVLKIACDSLQRQAQINNVLVKQLHEQNERLIAHDLRVQQREVELQERDREREEAPVMPPEDLIEKGLQIALAYAPLLGLQIPQLPPPAKRH